MGAKTMQQTIEIDGRPVAVHEHRRGGRTVVFCHPAPGSGCFDPKPAATGARDITLVALDRPGYGASSMPQPGRWATVAQAADDIAVALEQRGDSTSVGVIGWSAGGRVAAALAARHPDVVDRLVVMATPAPHDEVPWVPDEHAAALEALRGSSPDDVHAALIAQLGAMIPEDPHAPEALALVGAGASSDDAILAGDGVRDRLAAMLAEATRQGAAGMAADIAGYSLQPWGFDPSAVTAKTLVLYGGEDPIAGAKHAQWWKEQIGGPSRPRVEMVPKTGHLLAIPMWERALSHAAPGTKGS
jgi:pimeloyl-ACP methyl ester carboxylesterase